MTAPSPLPDPSAAGRPVRLPLLADGALWLDAAPETAPLVERWLPDLPHPAPDSLPPSDASVLHVRSADAGATAPGAPTTPSTLTLFGVACHVDAAAGRAALVAPTAAAWGVVRLDECDAEIAVADAAAPLVEPHVYTMATIASALLLGRLGRALVHAAAVVAPDGGAWLLAGDTHAGKTTTTVNLLDAGWRYVSDDHVVLARGGDGGLVVEGWPRRFHLDDGWEAGTPGQPRGEVDAGSRWPGRWMRSAPLAGLLFPRVSAAEPTLPERCAPADALARLLRQTPWLMADRARTLPLLALAQAAAEMPAYSLRVGLDTYRSPARLVEVLGPVTGG